MRRNLDAELLIKTLDRLQARIEERFPKAGLGRVCEETIEAGRRAAEEAAGLSKPIWPLRVGVIAVIILGVAAQIWAASLLHVSQAELDAPSLIQGLEATVNLLILFGGAAWFLITLEERFKRQRALDALHGLRSLAHVVDMHQLTKDPTIVLQAHLKTQASPVRAMTQFELTRYLDYCAEMLSLIGKLAALYADKMRDATVIAAVNDIETLTGNLGRKIWQKITIISALEEHQS
jgi:hypothetical protein